MAFCTSCGANLPDTARFCTSCGAPVDNIPMAQPAQPAQPVQPAQPEASAGDPTNQPVMPAAAPGQAPQYPVAQPAQTAGQGQGQPNAPATTGTKSKIAAGLLALFLGGLGIHKFYLGYTKQGVIMLLVSVIGIFLTAGIATLVIAIIAFIEAILYFTKSDEDFYRIYEAGSKPWF